MAANTLTQTFVSGTTGTSQSQAQDSFQTALGDIDVYASAPPLQVLFAGVEVTYNGTAVEWTYWAFVQYNSAS